MIAIRVYDAAGATQETPSFRTLTYWTETAANHVATVGEIRAGRFSGAFLTETLTGPVAIHDAPRDIRVHTYTLHVGDDPERETLLYRETYDHSIRVRPYWTYPESFRDKVAVAADAEGIAFTGNRWANIFTGSAAADSLDGGRGDDVLRGEGGRDRLLGGLGADRLTGGDGPDTFVFRSTADSPADGFDRIADFTTRLDRIDLSAIDAVQDERGNQAFRVADSFTGSAGEVCITAQGIVGDVDGDGIADLVIRVSSVPVEADLIL